jgi:hypothetical protein
MIRGRLHGLRLRELVETAARLRPGTELDTPLEATKQALRLLARRYQRADPESARELARAPEDSPSAHLRQSARVEMG